MLRKLFGIGCRTPHINPILTGKLAYFKYILKRLVVDFWNLRYDFWGVDLREMFEGDSADTCAQKIPLVPMRGGADRQACTYGEGGPPSALAEFFIGILTFLWFWSPFKISEPYIKFLCLIGNIGKRKKKNIHNSSSPDWGPLSPVCSCGTLCSTPHWH